MGARNISVRKNSYNTKQRDFIIGLFAKNRDRELTSRDVINLACGAVGDATVYRMLKRLLDEGVLECSHADGKGSAYRLSDDGCSCRFHLHCVVCEKIVHMNCGEMREAERHITEDHGFRPINKATVIDGFCSKCWEGKNTK